MELFLNTAWALLATVIVCQWLRFEGRAREGRRARIVALVMLIIILFPVISVSDDLWSSQNPAEAVSCQRRGHRVCCPHADFPAIAALPGAAVVPLNFGSVGLDAPRPASLVEIGNPVLHPIQNRPPPTA